MGPSSACSPYPLHFTCLNHWSINQRPWQWDNQGFLLTFPKIKKEAFILKLDQMAHSQAAHWSQEVSSALKVHLKWGSWHQLEDSGPFGPAVFFSLLPKSTYLHRRLVRTSSKTLVALDFLFLTSQLASLLGMGKYKFDTAQLMEEQIFDMEEEKQDGTSNLAEEQGDSAHRRSMC